jgi:hypothetical protein
MQLHCMKSESMRYSFRRLLYSANVPEIKEQKFVLLLFTSSSTWQRLCEYRDLN